MYIADLGYGTLPEARGRGVATAALRLLAQWLLDPVAGAGLPRAQLDHATANVGSCRVAVAAGFPKEGVRRSFLPLCDPDVPAGWARHDVCMHGRVAGAP
jgi:RimJ/RimL family protein N-acetyltransferase